MPHTLSYSEFTSSSPDLEFSPSRKNVFYIPIPPSGEIVFQSLTREQKRLLRNMGKPSPKQIFDESPPPTPEKRTFRRHSLVLSPVLPVSEDSDNPAYEMSPKVRESTEKVRLYKERLVAMRASRSPGSTSASVSSVTGSDVNTEKVVKASDNNSMRFEYPGVNESEDAHIQVCEAAHMPVMVGEGENKDGAWEPLFSGADEGRPFGLEGLGISVWTENTYNTGKLFKNDCSEGNFTVGSATERDEPTSGEVATTSADAVTLSTAPDIHQSHSCCNLLDVDCLMDFRVHEAAITPVPVKISDREDGIWEPIFSGSSKDKSLGLEGLGISIWIGSTHSVERLAQGSCSDDVVAINTAVGSEGSDVWEDIALSDDEVNVPMENTITLADVRSPPESDTAHHDAPSTPTIGDKSPLPSFVFSPGRRLCCTGAVSRSVLLLQWGWMSATFARKEGEFNYLERRIEKARKNIGVS